MEEVEIRRSKTGRWRIRRIGWALAVLSGAFVLVGAAHAHFDPSAGFTHGGCPAAAENRVDPINVAFHGWGTWGRVVSQIESHAGWTATSGSRQFFADHGECRLPHAQRASGHGTRFHVRIRGQHADAALGWVTTGDAHHEDLVFFPPCGHAVDESGEDGSGFDQGRDELRARFAAAGHATTTVWWGNTQSFKQCDGDYAASDGWAAFIELHQVNHS